MQPPYVAARLSPVSLQIYNGNPSFRPQSLPLGVPTVIRVSKTEVQSKGNRFFDPLDFLPLCRDKDTAFAAILHADDRVFLYDILAVNNVVLEGQKLDDRWPFRDQEPYTVMNKTVTICNVIDTDDLPAVFRLLCQDAHTDFLGLRPATDPLFALSSRHNANILAFKIPRL